MLIVTFVKLFHWIVDQWRKGR